MKPAIPVLSLILVLLTSSTVLATGCSHILAKRDAQTLKVSANVLNNEVLEFIPHVGPADKPFETALAMNVQYEPIQQLKDKLQSSFKQNFNIFTGWNKNGEAHVTTVTPVEYHYKLRPYVTPSRMNEIALELNIQGSDLEVLGLGRGTTILDGKKEDTYFVIVRSENLLRIRRAIHKEFVKSGGKRSDWDPEHFYPHITIAYTGIRDLHESDGVLKDVEHSLDPRFHLTVGK